MDVFSSITVKCSESRWVSFIIDGRDLADIVRTLGGQDEALDIAIIAMPHLHWTPFTEEQAARDAKSVVLACGCGDPGCGSTFAKITRLPDAVIWSDFEGWDGKSWGPFPIGPFKFTHAAYDAALAEGRTFAEEFRKLNPDLC